MHLPVARDKQPTWMEQDGGESCNSQDHERERQEETMSPQDFVADARARKDWGWTFFQRMTAADRNAFDAYLGSIQHPLWFEAGTQESRFRRFVQEDK